MKNVIVALVAVFAFLAFADDGCNTDQDKATFQAEWDTMHGKLQECALQCMGGESCAKVCIQKNMNFTDSCATCFAADVACTASSCMTQCIADQQSEDCLNCHTEKCYPTLVTCAQVPADIIPP